MGRKCVGWIEVAQDREKCWSLVRKKKKLKLRVSQFLKSLCGLSKEPSAYQKGLCCVDMVMLG